MTVDTSSPRIDLHHHLVPEVFRRALEATGVDSVSGSPFPRWNLGVLHERLDALAIDRAILSLSAPGVGIGPTSARPSLARMCNDEAAAIVDTAPDRLGLFATLPLPDVDASLDEVRRAYDELGADGVIALTNFDGVYLSDPRLEPVLAELDRRDAVVFVHPAVPPGAVSLGMCIPPAFVEFTFDTTRVMTDMIMRGTIDRFPRIRFVLAHLGGALPFLAWRLSMMEEIDRGGIFSRFDASGPTVQDYLRRFWYDTATCGPTAVAAAAAVVGTDRIAYGSDTPFAPARFIERTTAAFDRCDDLDAAAKEQIRLVTAQELLALPVTR